MTDENASQGPPRLDDNSDPLGIHDGIVAAKKILAEKALKKASSKKIKEAEETASFAQSLGLNGGTFRKALAAHEKHREEMDLGATTDDDTSGEAPHQTSTIASTKESTTPSTDTSTDNQTDKQSDSQIVRQSVDQSDNQSNTQSISQSDKQTDNQSINQAGSQSNSQTINQSNTQTIQQADKQTDNQTDNEADTAAGIPTTKQTPQQTFQQNGQQTIRQATPSTTASAIVSTKTSTADGAKSTSNSRWDAPKALRGLSKNDLTILAYIVERDPLTTTVDTISGATTIPRGTARSCLYKLKGRKFLDWNRTYDGCAHGTSYVVYDNTIAIFELHKSYIYQRIDVIGVDPSPEVEATPIVQQNHQQQFQQPDRQNNQQTIQQATASTNLSLDRKIKENLSICEELSTEAKRLYQLDDDDIQLLLPDLFQAGFTSVNIRSLIERRHKVGLDLSDPLAKMIHMGLRRANAALRLGGGTLKGTVNSHVENIPGYIFSTLLKEASFPKPAAWEPEEIVALQVEAERLRKEAELRTEIDARLKEEREEQEYQSWRNGLTEQGLTAFKERCPNKKSEEALERFLRIEWRKTLG